MFRSSNFSITMRDRKLSRTLPLWLALPAAGCQTAPSFNVLGSFFPVWIFCIITAILLTFGFRALLMRYKLDSEVGPLVIIYPSFASFIACSMWLLFFRS